jgi:hypothetical protein
MGTFRVSPKMNTVYDSGYSKSASTYFSNNFHIFEVLQELQHHHIVCN